MSVRAFWWARACGCALAVGLAMTEPAAAEGGTAPRRMLAAHEQAEWKGVGRLDVGGRGYCTATLLTETLALTAAHCLHDSRDGRRLNDAELFFAAGWRGGRFQSIRQVRRSAEHPDYRYGGPTAGYEEIKADVALVELDQPVLTSEIPNYGAAELPKPGGAVALLSYGRGRSDALSKQEPCRVQARWPQVARLDCEVAPGSSGSPVFARDAEGRPRVAAVISAAGTAESYAVVLSEVLPALRAALAAQVPQRKTSPAPGAASAAASPAAGSLMGESGGWKSSRPPQE
jgi:protease YdgD